MKTAMVQTRIIQYFKDLKQVWITVLHHPLPLHPLLRLSIMGMVTLHDRQTHVQRIPARKTIRLEARPEVKGEVDEDRCGAERQMRLRIRLRLLRAQQIIRLARLETCRTVNSRRVNLTTDQLLPRHLPGITTTGHLQRRFQAHHSAFSLLIQDGNPHLNSLVISAVSTLLRHPITLSNLI